jgi:hypothetical protein
VCVLELRYLAYVKDCGRLEEPLLDYCDYIVTSMNKSHVISGFRRGVNKVFVLL